MMALLHAVMGDLEALQLMEASKESLCDDNEDMVRAMVQVASTRTVQV